MIYTNDEQTEIECLRYEIRELQKQIEELKLFRAMSEFHHEVDEESYIRFKRRLEALEQFKSECEFVGLPDVVTAHHFHR